MFEINEVVKKIGLPFELLARKIVRADETIVSEIEKLPRKWVLHLKSYLEMGLFFISIILFWGLLSEYLPEYPKTINVLTIMYMVSSVLLCVLIHLERERWWIISMIKIEKNIDINKDEII